MRPGPCIRYKVRVGFISDKRPGPYKRDNTVFIYLLVNISAFARVFTFKESKVYGVSTCLSGKSLHTLDFVIGW